MRFTLRRRCHGRHARAAATRPLHAGPDRFGVLEARVDELGQRHEQDVARLIAALGAGKHAVASSPPPEEFVRAAVTRSSRPRTVRVDIGGQEVICGFGPDGADPQVAWEVLSARGPAAGSLVIRVEYSDDTGGLWVMAWRDETGDLVVRVARWLSSDDRSIAAAMAVRAARRGGWKTGTALPVAAGIGGSRAIPHIVRTAAGSALAAGAIATAAVVFAPDVVHLGPGDQAPPGGPGGAATAPAAALSVQGAPAGRHRSAAALTPPPVPSPAPLPPAPGIGIGIGVQVGTRTGAGAGISPGGGPLPQVTVSAAAPVPSLVPLPSPVCLETPLAKACLGL